MPSRGVDHFVDADAGHGPAGLGENALRNQLLEHAARGREERLVTASLIRAQSGDAHVPDHLRDENTVMRLGGGARPANHADVSPGNVSCTSTAADPRDAL